MQIKKLWLKGKLFKEAAGTVLGPQISLSVELLREPKFWMTVRQSNALTVHEYYIHLSNMSDLGPLQVEQPTL